jgi:hypothetical protein
MRKRPPPGNVIRPPSGRTRFKFEFISSKDETVIQAGKWHARLQAILFDRDPTIRHYRSYPLFIPYKDEKGIEKQYVPNFQVCRTDGSIEIHEITSTKQRKKESEKLREKAIERYCQSQGWRYVIHTELTTPDATMAVNLYSLSGYAARAYCENQVRVALLEDLELGKKLRIREVAVQLAEAFQITRGCVVATICWMIWNCELNTNMSILLFIAGEINKDAVIWRNGDQNEPKTS